MIPQGPQQGDRDRADTTGGTRYQNRPRSRGHALILRAVKLVGVDSVMAAQELRLRAWDLLDQKLDRTLLAEMTTVVPISQAIEVGEQIVEGKVRGRVVITID